MSLARSAARPSNPGRAPMPRIPSTTRSARPSCPRAVAASATRPPARRRAPRPPPCTRPEVSTASTRTPRAARRAPAHEASPPLLPGPTSSTTRRPYTPPVRRRSSPTTTLASADAARCIRAPSRRSAIAACSAARTASTACTLTSPPRASAGLGDHDGRGDAGVVAQRQMEGVDPQGLRTQGHGAGHIEVRSAVVRAVHGDVLPAEAHRRTQGLGERLLGGEPGGQRRGWKVTLGLGEEPLDEPGRAGQRLREALHVDDVDPDSDDHGVLTPP